MKRRNQLNKRKERGRGRGTADQGEKKRERERMGLKPLLYRPLSHPHVFWSIYLVRNPLPVDVGIIGSTTSNIVSIVVFSLPQTRCLEVSIWTRKFMSLQLAPSVGTDTASLGLSGGYHRVDRLPIYRTPKRSPPLELAHAATRRSEQRHGSSTRHHAQPSQRSPKPTPPDIKSSSGYHHQDPHHPIWRTVWRTASSEPPRAGGSSGGLSHVQHVLAHAKHKPAHARHTPGTRLARHVSRPDPDSNRIQADPNRIRARTESNPNRTEPI